MLEPDCKVGVDFRPLVRENDLAQYSTIILRGYLAQMNDLLSLNPTEFENLTFDLVSELGLLNGVWRTPGSDVGRDIEGEYFFKDISGYYQKQKWYIECKRHSLSVNWPTVWDKISYAEANSADVLLIATTSSLSPQAVDQVTAWNIKKKRPIIRILDGANILIKLNQFPQIAIKYGLLQPTEEKIYVSLEPLITLLITSIYSLSSSFVFNFKFDYKVDLTQAIADLISIRVKDYKEFKKTIAYNFIADEDYYTWAINSDHLTDTNYDKYGVRAVLSYLRYQCRADSLHLTINSNNDIIVKNCSPVGREREQLSSISHSSNFIVRYNDADVILENSNGK